MANINISDLTMSQVEELSEKELASIFGGSAFFEELAKLALSAFKLVNNQITRDSYKDLIGLYDNMVKAKST